MCARRCRRYVIIALYDFVIFNVALAIFNLIPVPPLDGSALLFRFLPPRQAFAAAADARPVRLHHPARVHRSADRPTIMARILNAVINFLVGR